MARQTNDIRFKIYGKSFESVTLGDLLAHQAENGDLWANAENSGCEGHYCEVARWNTNNHRFERFAFCKFFGGEMPRNRKADARATAEKATALINATIRDRLSVVHVMPDFSGEPITKKKEAGSGNLNLSLV